MRRLGPVLLFWLPFALGSAGAYGGYYLLDRYLDGWALALAALTIAFVLGMLVSLIPRPRRGGRRRG